MPTSRFTYAGRTTIEGMDRLPDPKIRFFEGQPVIYTPTKEKAFVARIELWEPRLANDYADTVLPARQLTYILETRGGRQWQAEDDEVAKSSRTLPELEVNHKSIRLTVIDRLHLHPDGEPRYRSFVDYGYQVREFAEDGRTSTPVLSRQESPDPSYEALTTFVRWYITTHK